MSLFIQSLMALAASVFRLRPPSRTRRRSPLPSSQCRPRETSLSPPTWSCEARQRDAPLRGEQEADLGRDVAADDLVRDPAEGHGHARGRDADVRHRGFPAYRRLTVQGGRGRRASAICPATQRSRPPLYPMLPSPSSEVAHARTIRGQGDQVLQPAVFLLLRVPGARQSGSDVHRAALDDVQAHRRSPPRAPRDDERPLHLARRRAPAPAACLPARLR